MRSIVFPRGFMGPTAVPGPRTTPWFQKRHSRVRAKSAPGSGRTGGDATRIRDYVLCMVAC